MISEKDRSELMIRLLETRPQSIVRGEKLADEGGCGVVGCASSVQIAGRHFLTALDQMKNRGNGKGGGVAMLGLDPEQWGVSADILRENFILQVAYLDESVISEVEASFVDPVFEVNHHSIVPTIDDHTSIDLEIRPPVVYQYFVRVKKQKIIEFANSIDLHDHELDDEFVYNRIEEEIVYQNSYLLNESFYASLGNKQAFVLSHAKNLLLFKLVGYGDQVIRYYKLQDTVAHIWIGHHRYPTKGTVWHPGGAHPFIGLNEALVHNGDFSNHHAVGEYLAQRNIYQQFLTDTEVAVLQFDLYSRIYRYPTEYIIEAIAPTTERDFWELPEDRQQLYERIQHSHLHGSPDGPWFFIIGRSLYEEDKLQLLGITDTSMLRPQVFALQQSDEVQIGLIGSERQAIDATLRSLSFEDNRFASKADIYWNARGGSHTDGGAFLFNVIQDASGLVKLQCEDKFGNQIQTPKLVKYSLYKELEEIIPAHYMSTSLENLGWMACETWDDFDKAIKDHIPKITEAAKSDLLSFLTAILDYWARFKNNKQGRFRSIVEHLVNEVCRSYPDIRIGNSEGVLINYQSKDEIREPKAGEEYLLIDIADFPPEGDNSAANCIVAAYELGWKHVITFDWRGQRFCGCGLGSNSQGFRIDVYGNSGDYLASGLDGAEIYVHGAAQDQVAQMMKSGKLVIYGDVGQTFMYGAKGGDIFVQGNAAGRPLINAVGRPRVVINGTCLDYLAESFMAGDPLKQGGFVILQGVHTDNHGKTSLLSTPYPGSNLFSLASGGAIYINDPHKKITSNQLHGGIISQLSESDADLLRSYLRTNHELFGLTPNSQHSQIQTNGWIRENYIKVHPPTINRLSH